MSFHALSNRYFQILKVSEHAHCKVLVRYNYDKIVNKYFFKFYHAKIAMSILTVGFKTSIHIYTYTVNFTCLGTHLSILFILNFCIRYFVNMCIYTDATHACGGQRTNGSSSLSTVWLTGIERRVPSLPSGIFTC